MRRKRKIQQLKPAVRFCKIKSATQNNLWKGVRVSEDVGNTACAFIIVLVRNKGKTVYLNKKKLYILIFTRIS